MPNITFAELASNHECTREWCAISAISDLLSSRSRTKLLETDLLGNLPYWFNMGMLQIQQVEDYVETTGSVDRTFVARLTSGFITQYQQQTQAGLQGDSLFAAMLLFSAQGRTEFIYQSAGLAVLVYLFERCEVFEQ